MIHIIPRNDLKPHYERTDCHCIPEVDWENELVIHNAFDHWELVEYANEIIKNKKLLPCPFCGQVTIVINKNLNKGMEIYSIECISCQVIMTGLKIDELIRSWNERV